MRYTWLWFLNDFYQNKGECFSEYGGSDAIEIFLTLCFQKSSIFYVSLCKKLWKFDLKNAKVLSWRALNKMLLFEKSIDVAVKGVAVRGV